MGTSRCPTHGSPPMVPRPLFPAAAPGGHGADGCFYPLFCIADCTLRCLETIPAAVDGLVYLAYVTLCIEQVTTEIIQCGSPAARKQCMLNALVQSPLPPQTVMQAVESTPKGVTCRGTAMHAVLNMSQMLYLRQRR